MRTAYGKSKREAREGRENERQAEDELMRQTCSMEERTGVGEGSYLHGE